MSKKLTEILDILKVILKMKEKGRKNEGKSSVLKST
jgi:hypothetical protein